MAKKTTSGQQCKCLACGNAKLFMPIGTSLPVITSRCDYTRGGEVANVVRVCEHFKQRKSMPNVQLIIEQI